MSDAHWWDVPEHEYHAATDWISQSMLKVFLDSPAEYYLRYVAGKLPPKEPTPAMQLGSMVHMRLLEPERFETDVIALRPDINFKRKADREERDALIAGLQPGQIVATTDDVRRACGIATSLRAHPIVAQLIKSAEAIERNIRWTHDLTGLPLRMRLDLLAGNILLDLKTMAAYPTGFKGQAIRFRYVMQAQFYRMGAAELGIDDPRFFFAAARTEAPYDVLLYEPDRESLGNAHAKIVDALERIDQCASTGLWEHPDAGTIIPLSVPPWA